MIEFEAPSGYPWCDAGDRPEPVGWDPAAEMAMGRLAGSPALGIGAAVTALADPGVKTEPVREWADWIDGRSRQMPRVAPPAPIVRFIGSHKELMARAVQSR